MKEQFKPGDVVVIVQEYHGSPWSRMHPKGAIRTIDSVRGYDHDKNFGYYELKEYSIGCTSEDIKLASKLARALK